MTNSADTRAPGDIARDTFRVLFDERVLSDPCRLWTDESVVHFMAAGESVRGAQPLAQWFRQLLEAVPDWKMEIENTSSTTTVRPSSGGAGRGRSPARRSWASSPTAAT